MTFLDKHMEKWLAENRCDVFEKWFAENIDIPANMNVPLRFRLLLSFNTGRISKTVVKINR